jgi:hypothetical protein
MDGMNGIIGHPVEDEVRLVAAESSDKVFQRAGSFVLALRYYKHLHLPASSVF